MPNSKDDKIIQQMYKICMGPGNNAILRALNKVERILDDYEWDEGEAYDDIYDACLPANKQVKKLIDLAEKISDEELQETILTFLENSGIEEEHWDEFLQNSASETGWDAVAGLDEWAEVTFGEYLESHDISVFDDLRD